MTIRTASRILPMLLLATSAAFAQDAQVTAPGAQTEQTTPGTGAIPEGFHMSINPYASYAFDADFHGTDSSMSVSRVGVDTHSRLPLDAPDWHLTIGLAGEYSNYRFSNPGPDLNLDLLNVQFEPGVEYRLSDQWTLYGGAILVAEGDTSADVGDAATYGGYLEAKHKISDKFSYTFGIAIASQIEDDARFSPLIGLDWQINDGLALTVDTSVNGGELRLTQSLSKTVDLSGVVGYEFRRFRLDDKPIVDGVLQDTRIPVGLEVAWRPNVAFALRGTVGYVVWQEIEFDDQHGNQLSQRHPDATPYVGVSATFQF